MISKKDICAIIVSYNSEAILPHCIEALTRNGIKSLVIDNASSDDTINVAHRHYAEVIENAQNLGFGRANNIGAKAIDAKWLLFINPDVVVAADFRTEITKALEMYPDAKIFGPQIIEETGRIFVQPRSLLSPPHLNNGNKFVPNGDCCLPFLSGACLLIERDKFVEIGGFDENIFLFYEDDDLCRRFCDNSLMPVYVHNAKVWHGRGKSSTESLEKSYKVRYHLAWSKIYISKKYGLKTEVGMDILKLRLKYFLSVITFNKKRQEHYRGSIDGFSDALKEK